VWDLSKKEVDMAVTKDTFVNVKFEDDVAKAIEDYATKHEMDRSKVVRLAVKTFLGYSPKGKVVKAKP